MEINETAHKNHDIKFLSKDFLNACCVKVTTTLLSVKVWGLFVCFTVPTVLLVKGHIDAAAWVSGFTIVPGVIYGMREIFKISSIWDSIKKDKTKDETTKKDEE